MNNAILNDLQKYSPNDLQLMAKFLHVPATIDSIAAAILESDILQSHMYRGSAGPASLNDMPPEIIEHIAKKMPTSDAINFAKGMNNQFSTNILKASCTKSAQSFKHCVQKAIDNKNYKLTKKLLKMIPNKYRKTMLNPIVTKILDTNELKFYTLLPKFNLQRGYINTQYIVTKIQELLYNNIENPNVNEFLKLLNPSSLLEKILENLVMSAFYRKNSNASFLLSEIFDESPELILNNESVRKYLATVLTNYFGAHKLTAAKKRIFDKYKRVFDHSSNAFLIQLYEMIEYADNDGESSIFVEYLQNLIHKKRNVT